MAEKIDELQLGISSDAQKALRDIGNLATSLGKAAQGAKTLSDNAAGVNNFVTGLKRLTDTDTDKLKVVTRRLRSLSKIDLSNIAGKNIDIGVSVNGSTEAFDNITNATKALKQLSKVKSSDLSKSGGAIGDNLISSSLQTGLNTAVNSAKSLFNWSLKLGKQGASALGSFMAKLGLIPGHTANVNRMALSFGNLLRTILPFVGLRGVFGWLKESVELGSSIVEIQNVIDTAFGDLKKGYDSVAGHIYNWSKTTMDAFGVSEIAALRYAGRLQSIFNSSGFDVSERMRNSASQMTTDLIERAGDIASFYDITVDEAMTKMQSGLVGMSRPLRSLGVNLSVANLQAFALSQGITTSWKSMDQATQMALRYQYILNATQYAAGDFQKTEMSLANQTRLLTMNLQVLSSTLGQGLVSAIAPVVGWLNALIKRLIQAATAFRTFMWTLFGKPLAAAKGVADDLLGSIDDSADAVGDLGSGAGGAADGLGSAGKAAKELKKQLTVLPFDELNQLAKDTDSASSGGSGGSGGGGGVGGLGDLDTDSLLPDFEGELENSPVVQAINRWAARIREAFQKKQWANLGRIVAEGINAGFGYIYDVLDYNKIKPKVVDGFIHPFQDAFNSMAAFIDWKLIGRTFARGLNDVVYILREWINGFEWRNYGSYFAEGLNAMIDGWDADAFGRLIADKFKMAWDFFGGFVETFDFKELGGKLKSGVLGFLDELDPKDMGKSLAGFANGIADTLIEMLGDKQVRDELASSFSEFINSFLEEFDEEDASYALQLVGDTIFGGLAKALDEVDKSELIYKLSTVLSSLPWGGIGVVIGIKAGASLAAGIFGSFFKEKAVSIISGLFPNIGGGAAGAASAASGAASSATGGGGIGSALTSVGIGTAFKTALVGLGIPAALIGFGLLMRKVVDNTGGIYQFFNKDLGSSDKTTVAEAQTKNQQALNKAGINGAGYSTQIQTVPQNQGQSKPTTSVVTQILKGVTDSSFKNTLKDKAELLKDPIALKTAKGKEDGSFVSMSKDYLGIANNTAIKTAEGAMTAMFRTTKSDFHGIYDNTATKTAEGKRTWEFNNMRSMFHGIANSWATKTADGYRTGAFNTVWDRFTGLKDKWVTAHVDIETNASKVVASVANGAGGTIRQVLASIWTENARGGLFTSPVGFQVFGEAGAEAAIPLERKSTMKRIASAIVDSGGMGTSNSDEIADAIAMRVIPAVASMFEAQSRRPVNVNATLYTENNEVLARAVNQGNRSLDKRYNPVAQFSY